MGLSINLSTDVFSGGTFELRDRLTQAPLAQINNTGFSDALLFRVSNDLEHRVTEVGKVAKNRMAGGSSLQTSLFHGTGSGRDSGPPFFVRQG